MQQQRLPLLLLPQLPSQKQAQFNLLVSETRRLNE